MLVKNGSYRRSIKAIAGVALAASSIGVAFGATTLNETGSSLLYPLFNLWVPAYTSNHSNVKINTAATGSGTGISQSTQGIVQMGASDAYLSGAMMKKHPGMLNIPVAISSQMINYNVPGENDANLKLSGPVLAKIYSGKIRYWDNKKIESMNPNADLPHHEIVTIHRSDGSGDTFLFTQFLTKSAGHRHWQPGYGTTVSWPKVPGEIGATGNSGMVTALGNNPYAVAYIGVSYKDQTDKAKLGEAMLKNKAGNFVQPTTKSVPAAAAQMVPKTPKSERISLIFAPGKNSYPIINYEYVLIKSKQSDEQTAMELKKFMKWAVNPYEGNAMKYLNQVHFMPLPTPARALTLKQIDKIHG